MADNEHPAFNGAIWVHRAPENDPLHAETMRLSKDRVVVMGSEIHVKARSELTDTHRHIPQHELLHFSHHADSSVEVPYTVTLPQRAATTGEEWRRHNALSTLYF